MAYTTNPEKELHDYIVRLEKELEHLRSAVKKLYKAGKWDCEALSVEYCAELWGELRDACGIEPGTATKLGIGA